MLILADRPSACASPRMKMESNQPAGAQVVKSKKATAKPAPNTALPAETRARSGLRPLLPPLHVRTTIVEPALPVERLAHDRVEIVARRFPAEHALRPVGLGDDGGGIAGATGGHDDRKIDPRNAFGDCNHLFDS